MKSKPRKKIEPQHIRSITKLWDEMFLSSSELYFCLFVIVCCFPKGSPQRQSWIPSSSSKLGILWSHAEVKVSELKVSSTGETYSIGNWTGFFCGHETPWRFVNVNINIYLAIQ